LNHIADASGIPKTNLQENGTQSPVFLQIKTPQNSNSKNQFKNLGIVHGRLFTHSWKNIQHMEHQNLQLSAAHAEQHVPFETDDDAAIIAIRELTAGNTRLESLRVCSH
jgi:hypothetical protein